MTLWGASKMEILVLLAAIGLFNSEPVVEFVREAMAIPSTN